MLINHIIKQHASHVKNGIFYTVYRLIHFLLIFAERDDSTCTGRCYGNSREDRICSEQVRCATAYPSICVLATGPYTPGLPGTVVMPSSDGTCPTGYVPAPNVTGYVSASGDSLPVSVPTSAAPVSDISGYVPSSVTPSYPPAISPSGYVLMPDTQDYAVASGAVSGGYIPPPSAPAQYPAPVTSSYGTISAVPKYAFISSTLDHSAVSSSPGYIAPSSASGYASLPSAPGYHLTSSSSVASPRVFIGIRCHWTEWHQWSSCKKTCYHHVKRRYRLPSHL